MVDYKEFFKKFYDDCISLKDSLYNYNIFLERGLSLCILKRCISNDDIPFGVELSSKDIFKILGIDTSENDIEIDLFKNYVILNLKSGIKILSLSNPIMPKMTQICSYDGVFVMSPEYSSFEPLEKLSFDLDIPIYSIESNLLKSKFRELIDEYVEENRNELMLLGCVDNTVDFDCNINSEMKKIISASYKANISIYDYLKEYYISDNLSKYISKYPSTKENKFSMHNLLLKYIKAEAVPYSEILTDSVKNDFKLNIKRSVSQRRELEKFIYKGWLDKPKYDLLSEYNAESISICNEITNVINSCSKDIVLMMNSNTIFATSKSSNGYQIRVNIVANSIKLGKYNFKRFTPTIECFDGSGFVYNAIRLETSQDRIGFAICENGVQVYPSVHN